MSTNAITAVFWILLGGCFLGILAMLEFGIASGPSGGAVGAWHLLIPLLFQVCVGVVFEATSSPAVRANCVTAAGIVFLWVAVVVFEVLVLETIKQRVREKRR